ncbi:MAG TPA: aromatic ring-hydroxylating dioxygenase subunit alpha [Burkholderiaceae bacterium]|nr:aromatic ring-hydroxylating dioxygenase subunit alpha [Burkholderiaceae bacterium]
MSDIGRQAHLKRSAAQLPVSAYFDESLFQRELDVLFRNGPSYVGHELMVPEVGDFHTLAGEHDGRVLIRSAAGVECLSNVCRHRQAVMLKGRGNVSNIVCPLHRWTYDLRGKLLGAPHFDEQPCLNLSRTPLQRWNGMLFEGARDVGRDLAAMSSPVFSFDGYRLDHVEIHECSYNWKTFLEVYMEDYHVQPFHPGLGNFVSCDDLRWEFGEWYSLQTVGISSGLSRPGTPAYRTWHEHVLRFNGGRPPEHGAVWLTYYPNVMVEWYSQMLVISWLIPRSPERTTNVIEFYFPEEVALFERELAEAGRAAYLETAVEDDEIALRMTAGRRALHLRGTNDAGPYQSPMEDGMQHFHEFMRERLGPI